MSTKIPKPLVCDRVAVGEVRAVLIGPEPRTMARLSLMDRGGISYATCILATWSPRSLKLLEMLSRSLEQDLIELYTLRPDEAGLDEFPEEDLFNGEAGLDDDLGIDFPGNT